MWELTVMSLAKWDDIEHKKCNLGGGVGVGLCALVRMK